MKRVLTFIGALFVFVGLKAQTTPSVKKETVKPGTIQPNPKADSLTTNSIKRSGDTFKGGKLKKPGDHIKDIPAQKYLKDSLPQMKQNPLQKDVPLKDKPLKG